MSLHDLLVRYSNVKICTQYNILSKVKTADIYFSRYSHKRVPHINLKKHYSLSMKTYCVTHQ